ncbi:hypothetical protein BT96DRAFT_919313 [Gymnopus androsaceus JB14]|uniref:Uncharacterized protein n=1 Tax=Gymnopus androsaceus JB14 TaxID=1447944 RepID=A0A6A4HNS3_9AGAR|nr:hypothetical protein BT96DRAFT_919313 [Gymnopus androsaceus JB14]
MVKHGPKEGGPDAESERAKVRCEDVVKEVAEFFETRSKGLDDEVEVQDLESR